MTKNPDKLLDAYINACTYPGHLDAKAVEKYLAEYLSALGITRRIVRLHRGWTLDEHPSLKSSIMGIINDVGEKRDALDALDARAALDALDARAARAALDALDALNALDARNARAALDARDARDARAALNALDALDARAALRCFAQWCLFRGSWWWSWDLSWMATTYFGARQIGKDKVLSWSQPIMGAFMAGCWLLFWTDEVLYWIAKPLIRVDENRRPHAGTGPALECDIEDLYFWHGILVPESWIRSRDTLDPGEVIRAENVELRAAGAAIIGWPKMLSVLNATVIDKHENPEIGELIEMTLPGLSQPGRFLKARCPRNSTIVEGVPRISDIDGLPIDTALAAQAWRIGDPQNEYTIPPKRT